MSPDVSAAELSSVTTAIEELAGRVTAIADGRARTRDDAVTAELYRAERALHEALLRLRQAARGLRPG